MGVVSANVVEQLAGQRMSLTFSDLSGSTRWPRSYHRSSGCRVPARYGYLTILLIAERVTLAYLQFRVSLAYASLAGLPPEFGIYCYLVGGLGYAHFSAVGSRQLAVQG